MSNIKYIVSQGSPGDVTSFSIINPKDGALVDQTVVQNKFNVQTDKVETHFYSLDGTLLQSFKDFTQYVIPTGKINKDQELIEINLDPEQDTVQAGYTNGDVSILYNFLRRILPTTNSLENSFFIEAISPDRTELRAVLATNLSSELDLVTPITLLKERIETSEFIEQFVLNFSNNRLVVGVNIDLTSVAGAPGVLVKLYEPLPDSFELKDIFTLEEIVSDSILFEVDSEITVEPISLPSLRGPNFDILDIEEDRNPTEFLTLSQLLPTGSSNLLQAILEEKGIELGIDYSSFENFIFFSSAKERVENFLYKATLISGSQSRKDNATLATEEERFATEIQNVINKFDHFERYLYFVDEFQNKEEVTQATYLQEAELYDELNFNKLTNSIPSYILEDSRNLPYLLFVDMIGQHFDNIWIYTNSLTDRYKADNRLDYGISKDLVKQAVENLGITLYRSNKSIESLFSVFEGETYITGSEEINLPIKQFPMPTEVTQVTQSSSGSVNVSLTDQDPNFSGAGISFPYGETLDTVLADELIADAYKEFDDIRGTYARIKFDYTITGYDETLPGVYAVGFKIDIPATSSIEVFGRDAEDPNSITGSVDTGYIAIPESSTPRISLSIYAPDTGLLAGDFHQTAAISNISVTYISKSLPKNDYLKEIYKRVYHNVPLLLKSKGTERGLRSLINCFGIPDSILNIKVHENTPLSFNSDLVLDYTTSSLDRIRIQATGSLVEGDTLSAYTSIQTYDTIYDENLSTVEIGFSPTDNVDLFISSSASVESLDDLIGDPSDYDKTSYSRIRTKAIEVLGETKPYNVQEFIRLIRFYDNALFRIVQDFMPARTELVSGVVIKPHLLERSKVKGTTAKWVKFFQSANTQQDMDFSHQEYGKNFQLEAELQIGSTAAEDSGVIPNKYSTSYLSSVDLGTNNEQSRYNGQLKNSEITVVSTDVSSLNRFKTTSDQTLYTDNFETSDYNINLNVVQESRRSTFRTETFNLRNAAVQDSNYTDTGLANARYRGSVKRPTFNPSGSDQYNSKEGDYPILRLQSTEGILFEKTATTAGILSTIQKTPPQELQSANILYSTVFRTNSQVGFRQSGEADQLITTELVFTSSLHPRVQTFVSQEVEGKIQRIANRKIYLLQQNGVVTTDENGKIVAILPDPEGNVPPSEASGSTIVYLTSEGLGCGSNTTATKYYVAPAITGITAEQLNNKIVYTDIGLSSPLASGDYGISSYPLSTAVAQIGTLAGGSGIIVYTTICSGGGTEGGGGDLPIIEE